MSSTSATLLVGDLRGNPRRMRKERFMRYMLFGAAAFSIVISALVVWTLFTEAWTFLSGLIDEAGIGALIDGGNAPGWYPRNSRFDIPTIVYGTLIVSMVSIVSGLLASHATAARLFMKSSLRRKRCGRRRS